jgi:hypothetical protein
VSRLDARARELTGSAGYDGLEADVLGRRLDPWSAADELLRGIGA